MDKDRLSAARRAESDSKADIEGKVQNAVGGLKDTLREK